VGTMANGYLITTLLKWAAFLAFRMHNKWSS